LREWSAPEQRHVLNIVRVGGPEGIADPVQLFLDDFQLHGLKCEPDEIVLLSWDTRFIITSPSQGTPQLKSAGSHKPGRIPKGYAVDGSLIKSRQSQTVVIPSHDRKHTYELRITHYEDNDTVAGQGGVIHHRTISTLIEKGATGRVVRERVLFKGTADEPID
jgi:hypothetical protein